MKQQRYSTHFNGKQNQIPLIATNTWSQVVEKLFNDHAAL